MKYLIQATNRLGSPGHHIMTPVFAPDMVNSPPDPKPEALWSSGCLCLPDLRSPCVQNDPIPKMRDLRASSSSLAAFSFCAAASASSFSRFKFARRSCSSGHRSRYISTASSNHLQSVCDVTSSNGYWMLFNSPLSSSPAHSFSYPF